MKKIALIIVLLMAAVVSSQAQDKTTIYRMVLKAVQEFDQLEVSGDVTVECRYDPEKAGFIVYHYNKDAGKKIDCRNDGRCLYVSGQSENNGVMTRIVVFYDQPIKRIVNNGDARVLSLRLVADDQKIELINNGSGDMRFGVVKTQNAYMEVAGSGNIAVKRVKIDDVETKITGKGQVILKDKSLAE